MVLLKPRICSFIEPHTVYQVIQTDPLLTRDVKTHYEIHGSFAINEMWRNQALNLLSLSCCVWVTRVDESPAPTTDLLQTVQGSNDRSTAIAVNT